jgi:hypothetical protein
MATNTTASRTFLTAATTTTGDSAINIKAINHRLLGIIGSAGVATKLTNLTSNDALQTVSYHVIENFVYGKNRPMEPLRAQVHNGLQDNTLKFGSDIVQLDHVYCHGAL